MNMISRSAFWGGHANCSPLLPRSRTCQRLHQDHKRERESFCSRPYPDLVGDDVKLQDDSMTEVIAWCWGQTMMPRLRRTSLNVKLKPRSEVSGWMSSLRSLWFLFMTRCEMESYGSRRVALQSSSHHFCREESPCLLNFFAMSQQSGEVSEMLQRVHRGRLCSSSSWQDDIGDDTFSSTTETRPNTWWLY